MRSVSHNINLYKIGKTGRSADERARKLSSATGVPTDFEVLFTREVGDIDFVEKETHLRLKSYRINRRREFFRCSPQTILETIESILEEMNADEEDVE